MQVPDPSADPGLAPAAVPAADVQVQPVGTAMVLAARGEFDVLTTPKLQWALEQALAEAPAVLVLDLTETTFFSSAALGCLIDARNRSAEKISLRLVAPRHLRRNLQMLGMEPLFRLFDTTPDALAAADARPCGPARRGGWAEDGLGAAFRTQICHQHRPARG